MQVPRADIDANIHRLMADPYGAFLFKMDNNPEGVIEFLSKKGITGSFDSYKDLYQHLLQLSEEGKFTKDDFANLILNVRYNPNVKNYTTSILNVSTWCVLQKMCDKQLQTGR